MRSIGLILLFFLGIGLHLMGQQYNFSNYTNEHGLAQSQVYAFMEDSRGYLWVGTDGGGLSLFDGINFTNFTVESGLPNNQIRSICEDTKGNMWFGTKDGYVCKYNGVGFIKYDDKNGLANPTVNTICEDKQGNLWFGTQNGLFILKDEKFQEIKLTKDSALFSVQTFFVDKYGKLWVGTAEHGVYVGENFRFKNLTTKNGLCNNSINSISEDIKGDIWFATNYGLSEYDGQKFYNYYQANGLNSNQVTCVLSDKSGNIWLGFNGTGVARYNGKEFVYFNESNGLCYNFIKGIIQDRCGNIWFSTDGAGICKFEGERFKHITEKDGLTNAIVMAIAEDAGGNLWFGTYGNGICKYTTDRKFTYITEKDGLCSDVIYNIMQDSKGNMWFGSKGGGVSIYDGKKFTNYSTRNGLPNDKVYDIIEDRQGNIIIATLGGGLSIFNGKTLTNIGKKEGLSSDLIYRVFEDKSGNLWLGYDDAGADMIFADYNSNEIIKNKKIDENNILNFSRKFGMTNNQVLSITQDNSGNIWFGTFGGGICRFNGTEIKTISMRDGLNSNNVYLLLVDSQGFLWVGTEKGINRVSFYENESKPSIKTYGKSEGFRGIETNFNSAIEDSKGFLWFGTVKGVTQYLPNFDHPNILEPKTSITDIKLFFEKTNWGEYSDNLSSYGGIPTELTLPYDKNHLTFKFVGIDMKAPEKVQYQWILEGFDKKWSPPSYTSEVIYSYIPYGEYTYKVKACNNDGIWNKEPASFQFTITPPFWQTWWFFTLSTIAAISIIVLFVRWRLQKLKREKEILEEKVEQRTIELRKEKAVVEQQSEEIRAQAEHLMTMNKELEKLSIVASETDNSVMISDKDGVIDWVNEGFTKLFGYTFNEFKNKFGDNFISTSSNPDIQKIITECKEKQRSVVYHSPATTRNGKKIWVQTTLTPIFDNTGNLRQFVAIDSDITPIKLAEEEIRQQKEEIESQRDQLNDIVNKLKELESFKDSMTGMIVHDLKNHLNSVITFSSQVFSEKNMKRIQQAGKQMLTMVLNILDVQKFEDAKVQLNTNVHNILTVVKSALNDVSLLINEKGIDVRNNIRPQFQSSYDYDVIQRVIVNLLTNAVKYTPAGGKIMLDAEPVIENNQEYIRLSVSDTGTGIPKEFLGKVFEKFTQVSAKKSGGAASTGLGLTFCRMVVEAHKGRIWVESEVGKGSSFIITLPKAGDASKEDAQKMEYADDKEAVLSLSDEDKIFLEPHLAQIGELEIYDISQNLNVLNQIKVMNDSPPVIRWADKMETSVFNFNEFSYRDLIKVAKRT